ncbi:MAG: leucyl/phenylalanyl-tRNA--protein transferase [Proteobacteria bacterium]|nr:leucyl/phenylalanyl-tRNA--protein transferase [Pseudomonadota bacterium]MCP4915296.1 leucyl/phenylalanyl-tRNA--protein transferase [Pseudomonadota bacterium]
MPVFSLPPEHVFPDPALAREDGLLAVGGDLHPHRLLLAYAMGIFPWYSDGQPILWHSPDPRFVLLPEEFRVQRSLRKVVKKRPFQLTLDTCFAKVIDKCSATHRPGQRGTWITREMRDAYLELHELGFAHSVEAWQDGELVGGLYGVSIGRVYFGESMFSAVSDASKVAFVHLVHQLVRWDFQLIDSQVYTRHLARFGAREMPRRLYLKRLEDGLAIQSRRGAWVFDKEVLEAE